MGGHGGGLYRGLPLFFETGLMLLLPVMAAAAGSLRGDRNARRGCCYAR
jgi:hypothetical protein